MKDIEMVCVEALGFYTFKATYHCEKCNEDHIFLKAYSRLELIKSQKRDDIINEFKKMAINYFDMPCPK